jgi:hypothetical protein
MKPKVSATNYTVNRYLLVVYTIKRRKDYRFKLGEGEIIKVSKIQESAITWF